MVLAHADALHCSRLHTRAPARAPSRTASPPTLLLLCVGCVCTRCVSLACVCVCVSRGKSVISVLPKLVFYTINTVCLRISTASSDRHAVVARVRTWSAPCPGPGASDAPRRPVNERWSAANAFPWVQGISAPHVVSAGAFGAGGGASGAGGAIAGAAARGGICSGGASFCSGGICSGGICSGGGCRGGGCAAAPWALCKEVCRAAPTAARLCVKHGRVTGRGAGRGGGGGGGGGGILRVGWLVRLWRTRSRKNSSRLRRQRSRGCRWGRRPRPWRGRQGPGGEVEAVVAPAP